MAGSAVKACTPNCVSTYQDKMYGRGRRVMNARPKKGGHVCTVCGTPKGDSASLGKSKAKSKK